MADTRIRNLERLRSQGDAAAETRLLLERLRAGQLAPEVVELLALLGHLPAREALGAPPAPVDDDPDLREWIWDLLPYGRAVVVRAALALGREVLDRFEERWPGASGPREALEAAAAWTDQRPLTREALMQHEGYALRAAEDALTSDQEASLAAFTAFHVVRSARFALEEGTKPFLYQVAQTLHTARGVGLDDETLRTAVEAELLAWTLEQTA